MGMHFFKNSRGQSLIEYVILVALVGVATMGMVRLLQKTVKTNLANVVASLSGETNKYKAEKVTEEELKKTDFTNFMNGAASSERR